ncbi:MAG: DNA polymerase III subunit alpha, partial [Deltaproteobacteria bacterium]
VMVCIQTGKTLDDDKRLRFESDQLYFRSQEEMIELFNYCPQAIENTATIAERCNLKIELGSFYLPKFEQGVSDDDAFNAFKEKTWAGFEAKKELITKNNANVSISLFNERLESELNMIKDMGFAGYFLIVSDFIGYAKKNNIPVGPGRGSAAGSLVAYCLGITAIDPIRYGLLFERFLNPDRRTMPDIDIDFCPEGRGKIIQYVMKKYGADHVAQIVTFGTLKARASIRDVGRVLGMAYSEVDAIVKLIPAMPLNITIDEAIKNEPRLKEAEQNNEQIKKLLNLARSIEGLNRQASTHAAGVVISDVPLLERTPLCRTPREETVVTQYAMKDIETVGLLKFDFLALKTLTIIKNTIELIATNRSLNIDIDTLPLDDTDTFLLLQRADTDGVFQLESDGMRDLLKNMRPDCIEDVIALIALYRPGPMKMIPDFIKRKHGTQKISYIVPELEEILKETYGIILYQEQVMQIANIIGGYSFADADSLRRMMGKKDRASMNKEKPKFLSGAQTNKIGTTKAETIWEQMETFAEYGFNKSHSAAYAIIAFQTAYLKAHYPLEFVASLLSAENNNREKIIKYLGSCRNSDIKVLPPDVNESQSDFSVSGDYIRFGLSAIKNAGKSATETIIKQRAGEGKFKDFFDFCSRIDGQKVNKKVMESLVKAGAFDSLYQERYKLINNYETAFDYLQKQQESVQRNQSSLFEGETENGSSENSLNSILNNDAVTILNGKEILKYEKEVLGFYVTGHPLDEYLLILEMEASVDMLSIYEKADKANVALGGIVTNIKTVKTKKNDTMAYLTVEDLCGSVDVIVFPDTYQSLLPLLENDEPIFIRGHLDVSQDDENKKVKVVAKEISEETHLPFVTAPNKFGEMSSHNAVLKMSDAFK